MFRYPRRLFLCNELGFGKFAAKTPLQIWTGSPGYVSNELNMVLLEQLDSEVTFNGESMSLVEAWLKVESDSLKFPLPKSVEIGMLGENAVHLDHPSILYFIQQFRGEPSYISWLINHTEHFFDPDDLEKLIDTKSFKHEHIDVKLIILSSDGSEYEVGFQTSFDTYSPTITPSTLDTNRAKFDNDDDDDDYLDYGNDWNPADDIDPDNPFGVSPDEAETIYWNTH